MKTGYCVMLPFFVLHLSSGGMLPAELPEAYFPSGTPLPIQENEMPVSVNETSKSLTAVQDIVQEWSLQRLFETAA